MIMAYAATVQVIHPSPTSSYPSPPYSAFLLTTYTLQGGEKEKPLISAIQPHISFATQETAWTKSGPDHGPDPRPNHGPDHGPDYGSDHRRKNCFGEKNIKLIIR